MTLRSFVAPALIALCLAPSLSSSSYAATRSSPGSHRHGKVPETAVRATLGDGQVLMGEIRTKTLLLRSGSGDLEIPLEDVGEVVPATGGQLGDAEGRVDVWLRNGSELRGTWAEPKLAMSIRVGGADVPVDLPMNELSRFQLQGGARWPGGPIYRMRTRFGDDFLVDPARTHLVIVNDFGTFQPLLSECQSVAPVGDPEGPWRIQLQTGTVLLGKMADNKVTVALPMGPAEVSVPLAQFVSLKVESWAPVAAAVPTIPATLDLYGGGYGRDDGSPVINDGPARKDMVQASVNYGLPEEAFASGAPAELAQSLREVRSSSRGAPSRAAPSVDAPAPADAWFDSADMAKSKSSVE